jgi:hypothetical protein
MQKGTQHTEETKVKMRSVIRRSGKDHPMWKGRIQRSGYWYLFLPDYPSSGKQGYVAEHRYIMEKALGRFLDKKEVVHHINHIKTDNRVENLKVYESRGKHTATEHRDAFEKARIKNTGVRRSVETEFKKGQHPWNYGCKYSPNKECLWAECDRSARYSDGGKKGYCSKHIQYFRRTNTCPAV